MVPLARTCSCTKEEGGGDGNEESNFIVVDKEDGGGGDGDDGCEVCETLEMQKRRSEAEILNCEEGMN